jgi:hypothetical protein
MMPPEVFDSLSTRRRATRSWRGRNFICGAPMQSRSRNRASFRPFFRGRLSESGTRDARVLALHAPYRPACQCKSRIDGQYWQPEIMKEAPFLNIRIQRQAFRPKYTRICPHDCLVTPMKMTTYTSVGRVRLGTQPWAMRPNSGSVEPMLACGRRRH